MGSKIYTKTGDKGQTSLLGGTRLPKHHVRIDSYGNVDELNSYIGLIRDQIDDQEKKELLIHIQDRLFTIGSHLASDPEHLSGIPLPEVHETDVTLLEKEIDQMTAALPELRSFVLPGGHEHVSHCHIARCVCRRAERSVVHLAEISQVNELHIKYLNRLSDFLFVLARWISNHKKAIETPWKPRS